MDKKLIEIVSSALYPHGFKRKKSAWYRDLPEVWQMVEISRDWSWADRYSLFAGVFVKDIEPNTSFPKPRLAHIRVGVPEYAVGDRDYFRYKVLDLQYSMQQETREQLICQALLRCVDSFFCVTTTVSQIRALGQPFFQDKLLHAHLIAYMRQDGNKQR